MSDILCVTSRSLCREDFLTRLERVAAAGPAGVILREKDLPPEDYRALAERALALCRARGVPCILHSFPETAEALGERAIHLPLPLLRALPPERRGGLPGSGDILPQRGGRPGSGEAGVYLHHRGPCVCHRLQEGPGPQGAGLPPGGVPRRGSPGVGHRRHHPGELPVRTGGRRQRGMCHERADDLCRPGGVAGALCAAGLSQ